MITFDDGYRSNYELLFLWLKKYNMKAAIAVIVKKLDDGVENWLTWDMCREMNESGLVEIGSYTFGLHNLEKQGRFVQGGINGIPRIPHESDDTFQKRVLDDLQKRHDRIAAKIGDDTFFSYPYGMTEPDAEPLLETLSPVTLTTNPGIADLQKGHRKLPRLAVNMDIALDGLL